jgi:1-acyl-sn-glycerol-3-phosphate acyltransferase
LDEWSYEPAPDLEKSIAERMRHFPRYPDMTVYALRSGFQIALRAFLRSYFRLNVRGREHLPVDESFVMVCNHSSHLDALCLLSSLPLGRVHRAFPVAAADYFFSSLPRTFISVIFVNGLPFDRESKGGESLEVCRQLLSRPGGNILILFPVGTRGASGTFGRFRSGIGRLVAGTGTPVVPCHLSGAREAFPKGARLPRPRALRLRIGRARTFPDVSPRDYDGVESLCDQLRDDVVALGK